MDRMEYFRRMSQANSSRLGLSTTKTDEGSDKGKQKEERNQMLSWLRSRVKSGKIPARVLDKVKGADYEAVKRLWLDWKNNLREEVLDEKRWKRRPRTWKSPKTWDDEYDRLISYIQDHTTEAEYDKRMERDIWPLFAKGWSYSTAAQLLRNTRTWKRELERKNESIEEGWREEEGKFLPRYDMYVLDTDAMQWFLNSEGLSAGLDDYFYYLVDADYQRELDAKVEPAIERAQQDYDRAWDRLNTRWVAEPNARRAVEQENENLAKRYFSQVARLYYDVTKKWNERGLDQYANQGPGDKSAVERETRLPAFSLPPVKTWTTLGRPSDAAIMEASLDEGIWQDIKKFVGGVRGMRFELKHAKLLKWFKRNKEFIGGERGFRDLQKKAKFYGRMKKGRALADVRRKYKGKEKDDEFAYQRGRVWYDALTSEVAYLERQQKVVRGKIKRQPKAKNESLEESGVLIALAYALCVPLLITSVIESVRHNKKLITSIYNRMCDWAQERKYQSALKVLEDAYVDGQMELMTNMELKAVGGVENALSVLKQEYEAQKKELADVFTQTESKVRVPFSYEPSLLEKKNDRWTKVQDETYKHAQWFERRMKKGEVPKSVEKKWDKMVMAEENRAHEAAEKYGGDTWDGYYQTDSRTARIMLRSAEKLLSWLRGERERWENKLGKKNESLDEGLMDLITWVRQKASVIRQKFEEYRRDPEKAKADLDDLERQYGDEVSESLQESDESPSWLVHLFKWMFNLHPSTKGLVLFAVAIVSAIFTFGVPAGPAIQIYSGLWVALLGWTIKLRGFLDSPDDISETDRGSLPTPTGTGIVGPAVPVEDDEEDEDYLEEKEIQTKAYMEKKHLLRGKYEANKERLSSDKKRKIAVLARRSDELTKQSDKIKHGPAHAYGSPLSLKWQALRKADHKTIAQRKEVRGEYRGRFKALKDQYERDVKSLQRQYGIKESVEDLCERIELDYDDPQEWWATVQDTQVTTAFRSKVEQGLADIHTRHLRAYQNYLRELKDRKEQGLEGQRRTPEDPAISDTGQKALDTAWEQIRDIDRLLRTRNFGEVFQSQWFAGTGVQKEYHRELHAFLARKYETWKNMLMAVQTTAQHHSLLRNLSRKTGKSVFEIEGMFRMAVEGAGGKYPVAMIRLYQMLGLATRQDVEAWKSAPPSKYGTGLLGLENWLAARAGGAV